MGLALRSRDGGGHQREPRRFYSVAETASLLGTSEMTVYRAIAAGEFPAVRVRGRLIVPARAVDEIESAAMAAVQGDPDEAASRPEAI